MIIEKENLSTRRSTCLIVALYNTNPSWTALEIYPVRSGEEPAINSLSCGTTRAYSYQEKAENLSSNTTYYC
jgi:hypothetical protein